MMDNTEISAARRALMSRVRSKNTRPELIVRRLLHRLGYRFRLHRKDLPGTPDIILPRYRLAIFVNGCFWHQHPGCRDAGMPKTRVEFWGKKLADNVARDRRRHDELAKLGWRVLVIWECEINRLQVLSSLLEKELAYETETVVSIVSLEVV